MVPGLGVPSASYLGFPRPRGDGPSKLLEGVCCMTVPPPTRGWSLIYAEGAARGVGSPAHAGMVPRRGGDTMTKKRFPRPRGDGPWLPAFIGVVKSVPPPTRGWSPTPRCFVDVSNGSPAHAGMVLGKAGGSEMSIWFPRPRGDGPDNRDLFSRVHGVPPPTRGWSP